MPWAVGELTGGCMCFGRALALHCKSYIFTQAYTGDTYSGFWAVY